MSPDEKDLIKYRLNRARDTLTEARINLDNLLLFATANRCYYAAFYAVSALLLTKNKSSSKHSGILSLFKSEIVKKGSVSEAWGNFYQRLFKYRLKADYEDFAELNVDEIKIWLEKTEEFVNVVEKITKDEIA
jgi:uncharacterized protein (UPF0332 family)